MRDDIKAVSKGCGNITCGTKPWVLSLMLCSREGLRFQWF